MKILFYLHRFPAIGGIENVTAFLANSFCRQGHVVFILSHVCVENQVDAQKLDDQVSVKLMPEQACKSNCNRKFLQNQIATFNPDVIVFQDSYAPIQSNLFISTLSVPVVVCEHNSPFACYLEPNTECGKLRALIEWCAFPVVRQLKYLRDRWRRQFLYKRCWRYVLLSDWFIGEFRAVTRLGDLRKLRVIRNAMPVVSSKKPLVKHDEVLFVGSLDHRKGLDLLIDVWCRIAKKFPMWTLRIVGDGPLRTELETKVRQNGVTSVCFEGFQSDSSPYFDRAKIFAFPSRREGLPLVLLEAVAHKCIPIVFDSYSSVRDVISNHEGVVIPAFDTGAFAHSLENLMRERFDQIRDSQINDAFLRFSQENVLGHWKTLFEELATDHS